MQAHDSSTTVGVLVVENKDGLTKMLNRVLRMNGFRVWVAADGVEALDLLRRNHAEVGVILSDVLMPRLDGFQLLERVQQRYPDLPVCFMSIGAGQTTPQELLWMGAAGVFEKPFQVTEVMDRLRQLARRVVTDPPRAQD
jgi:DNA-binding response OmpR family regulator